MSSRRIQFLDGSFKEVSTSSSESGGDIETVGFYTKDGVLEQMEYYNEVGMYRLDEFKDGVKCKETWYRPDETKEKTIEYEDDGKVIKTDYDELGKISSSEYVNGKITRAYTYSLVTNEVIKCTIYNKNGLAEITNGVITQKDQFGRIVPEKYTFNYNNGVKTSAIYYYANGTKKLEYKYLPSKTLEYTYAKDGKLYKLVERTQERIRKCEETYIYPKHGVKLIQTIEFIFPYQYTVTERKVDEKKGTNKIKSIAQYSDYRKIEEFVYGKKKDCFKWYRNGKKYKQEEIIKTANHKIIKRTEYDDEEVVSKITMFDFDDERLTDGDMPIMRNMSEYVNIGGKPVLSKTTHYFDGRNTDLHHSEQLFFEDGKIDSVTYYRAGDIVDHIVEYNNDLPNESYRLKNGVMTLYSKWVDGKEIMV